MRKIVQTRRYLRDMKRLGASAVEIARLEETIAANPTAGDVIPALGVIANCALRCAEGGNGPAAGRFIF